MKNITISLDDGKDKDHKRRYLSAQRWFLVQHPSALRKRPVPYPSREELHDRLVFEQFRGHLETAAQPEPNP